MRATFTMRTKLELTAVGGCIIMSQQALLSLNFGGTTSCEAPNTAPDVLLNAIINHNSSTELRQQALQQLITYFEAGQTTNADAYYCLRARGAFEALLILQSQPTSDDIDDIQAAVQEYFENSIKQKAIYHRCLRPYVYMGLLSLEQSITAAPTYDSARDALNLIHNETSSSQARRKDLLYLIKLFENGNIIRPNATSGTQGDDVLSALIGIARSHSDTELRNLAFGYLKSCHLYKADSSNQRLCAASILDIGKILNRGIASGNAMGM